MCFVSDLSHCVTQISHKLEYVTNNGCVSCMAGAFWLDRLQDGAKAYMRNHNVPKEMQQRVQRWYDYAWSRSVSGIFTHSRYALFHVTGTNTKVNLWYQLPHSLRQPRLDLPLPDSSLLHDHLTSPMSSSPLLSSITPSFFHSRLKTFLFFKSYPPYTSGTFSD